MHMKYTEDIIVFGYHKPTFNKQMSDRISPRIKQAHKTHWIKKPTEGSEVSFMGKQGYIDSKKYSATKKNPTDYLNFPSVVNNSHEYNKHPTQKPVKLLEYLIKTYSNKGDTILDNTMGSGSTGVAAVNLNRDFIGYELEQDYFDIATKRTNKAIEDHK